MYVFCSPKNRNYNGDCRRCQTSVSSWRRAAEVSRISIQPWSLELKKRRLDAFWFRFRAFRFRFRFRV